MIFITQVTIMGDLVICKYLTLFLYQGFCQCHMRVHDIINMVLNI